MIPLEYHRSFWRDADGYFRWYQSCQAGLGRDFLDEVGKTLAEIEANPARFASVTATIHQGQLHRFPFSIFCRPKSDRVRILALWHNSRGSSAWKYRR